MTIVNKIYTCIKGAEVYGDRVVDGVAVYNLPEYGCYLHLTFALYCK